jgi:hypothetical protein
LCSTGFAPGRPKTRAAHKTFALSEFLSDDWQLSCLSPDYHPQRDLKRHAVGAKKTGRVIRPEVSFMALRDSDYVAHEMVFALAGHAARLMFI